MSGSKKRNAAAMQQPPAEEAVAVELQGRSSTDIAAWRLACANARAARARMVQVEDRASFITTPKTVKPLFWDLARFCMCNDVDNFERYIFVQYKYSVAGGADDKSIGKPPNPGSFKSEQALDRYIRHDRTADKYLRHTLQTMQREFACCVSESVISFPHRSESERSNIVLRNKMLDLSALFRYCTAVAQNFMKTALEFQPAAREQFLTDPIGYSRAWGAVIPQALKADSEKLILTRL